jgi:hypothetical protein
MHDPYTSTIRLSESDELGATMNKIRSWLDGQKIQAVTFKTLPDAMGHIFTIGFRTIEDATRFRAQFGA